MVKKSFRFPNFLILLILIASIASTKTASSPQDESTPEGVINLRDEASKQIDAIKMLLSSDPDMPAKRQATLLLWLIELCDSTGRFQDAKNSYMKILSFFPTDVGIINQYAQFSLDQLGNLQLADSLLRAAQEYGALSEVYEPQHARTMYLLAKLHLLRNEYKEAIKASEKACFLSDQEGEEQIEALGLLSLSLEKAEQYEKAAKVSLKLIGKRGFYHQDDLDRLKKLLSLARRTREEEPEDLAREAIRLEKVRRSERAKKSGARIVEISSGNGFTMEAALYKGKEKAAVLLVPAPGKNRFAYRLLSQLLFTEGISSLSLDLRGFGGGESISSNDQGQEDAARFAEDVFSGVAFLLDSLSLSEDHIVIISEGGGCAVTEETIYNNKLNVPALYLSPFFDPSSKEILNALAFRPDSPVFIIYSVEDMRSSISLDLFRRAKKLSKLEVLELENAGYGTMILKSSPKTLGSILKWIKQVLDVPSD